MGKRQASRPGALVAAAVVLGCLAVALAGVAGGAKLPRAGAARPDRVAVRPAPKDHFQVVVAGASPEGIAAAVSAARAGAETLLLDTAPEPGGLITRGWLNQFDLNHLPDGSPAIRGFYAEVQKRLGGESFDVGRAREVFAGLLAAEPRLTVALGLTAYSPVVEGALVTGVDIDRSPTGAASSAATLAPHLTADRFIDATPDATFAAQAGARFTVGREELNLGPSTMAATLVFRVRGVDWPAVQQALANDGDPLTGATERSAWGFGELGRAYPSPDPALRLRGLNLGREDNGDVLLNSLLLFGADPLDPASLAEARSRGVAALPGVVDYLRAFVPGFSGATLAGAAPELYVRESRHLKSLYRLTIDDLLEHRDFPDKIVLASYPVDLQAYTPDDPGQVVGNPGAYTIPFRALVPKGFDNLLVVGRSAGYDLLAHGSARVLPVGMAEGQAAGLAAVRALAEGLTFPEFTGAPMARLQADLRAAGAYLPPVSDVLPADLLAREEALTRDSAYPAVQALRRLGLLSAGYLNDYRLDELLSPEAAASLSEEAFRRAGQSAARLPWSEAPLTRRFVYERLLLQLTPAT